MFGKSWNQNRKRRSGGASQQIKTKQPMAVRCNGCGLDIIIVPTSNKWLPIDIEKKEIKKDQFYFVEQSMSMNKSKKDLTEKQWAIHVCDQSLRLPSQSNGPVIKIK